MNLRIGRRVPSPMVLIAVAIVLAASPVAATPEGQQTKLVMEEYFLHAGGAVDQLTKLTGDDPTFDQDRPEGDDEAVQVASRLGSAAQPLGAYWVGEFSGTVSGEMHLTLHVAAPSSAPATVSVFADPSGSMTQLGSQGINLVVGASTLGEKTVTLEVSGTVDEELLIMVTATQTSQWDTMIFYDAEDVPSGFLLPTIVPCEEKDTHPDCQ